ncbi:MULTISPECIES: hypothetical protein [unclassified Bradyrhizobium]|uniref:hypothetical protein n=1 Tax=unclassified Bradyrhizobium TaxID=2631580 RepID=UPI00247ABA06|nr:MULTISPECIES: hypothetical protein [unclassified Bradyrhizobium]WGR74312.1 hypothetical protein MTX24_16440 [Bradyrhizobium sp. ISRA426]WGR79147.1 hypothetical protein MTX21_01555 [Bradyrhizobium sp. ISRA430]WGR90635.1 hypothetical protein MTX25_39700 [Bradyrhizobium sp. ISRA432]
MSKRYTLDADLMPIMRGDVPLPNPEPIEADIGAIILHYNSMQSGCSVLLPGETSKKWNVSFFLDHGQGGQLYGSGIVAWTKWDNEKRASVATGLKFAICQHKKVDGPGANHSRGWHPGHCEKCGLDMTVDSGD